MTTDQPPIALTIAGSDSGGGAGIQADLKTFHAFGAFGTSVITAVTAQNTLGVSDIHPIPLTVVQGQIDAVVEDLRPAAFKSGMLATAELVALVADSIRRHGLERYILDPVMVATSGDRLLAREAESALSSLLLPLCTLVTPNVPEARILSGLPVEGLDGMREAARRLVDQGADAALIKGGHLEAEEVTDLLWDGKEERLWRRHRVATTHTHGTGCTLSAAVAASLALGLSLAEAVGASLDFVARAIETAPGLGSGHGPVNHFVPPELPRHTQDA